MSGGKMMVEFQRRIGKENFSVKCAPQYRAQVNWLFEILENKINNEGCIDIDGPLDIGLTSVQFKKSKNNVKILEHYPSLETSNEMRDDLTRTLSIIQEQKAFLKELGIDESPIRLKTKIVFDKNCLEEKKIFLERIEVEERNYSGWFIGTLDTKNKPEDRESNYQTITVSQLLENRPALVRVLGLPPGYMAIFDGHKVTAVINTFGENLLSPG
ncbi:hypothetical protein ACFL35_02175 [Candidatus Riflebacteria bacterium]